MNLPVSDTYAQARMALPQSELTSNLDTDEGSTVTRNKKRKSRPSVKQHYPGEEEDIDGGSEDSEEESSKANKKTKSSPQFPKLVTFHSETTCCGSSETNQPPVDSLSPTRRGSSGNTSGLQIRRNLIPAILTADASCGKPDNQATPSRVIGNCSTQPPITSKTRQN